MNKDYENKLIEIMKKEHINCKEMDYSFSLKKIIEILTAYYAVFDIIENENNCSIIKSLFIDEDTYSFLTLDKLGISKSTYFRKKKEYIEIVKILLLPQNLEKLRICEHTNEKEEKNSSFPKSGNILHSFYVILKSKKNVFLKKLGGKIK